MDALEKVILVDTEGRSLGCMEKMEAHSLAHLVRMVLEVERTEE